MPRPLWRTDEDDGAMTESNAIGGKHYAVIWKIVGERSAKEVSDKMSLTSFLEERYVRGNGPD